MKRLAMVGLMVMTAVVAAHADKWPKPYDRHCTERENVFAFTQKPAVKDLGNDKYEIAFAVKGYCDVTVGIVDADGKVVRHVGSGVLGKNAPLPFQKNSLSQTIYWDGKDDLEAYVKEPKKLRVRVMLGLKPEFDKRLGGTSPKNIPGCLWGLAISEEGVFVFGHGHQTTVRKFDHDGNYVQSLIPPSATLPESKLKGMGYIEYEKGKRAVHPPAVNNNMSGFPQTLPGSSAFFLQPAIVGKRIYYVNMGNKAPGTTSASLCRYIYTDGSTDLMGMKGFNIDARKHPAPRLAASSDGKWLYMVGMLPSRDILPAVLRISADGSGKGSIFIGDPKSPGKGNQQFNKPHGIDCDAQGRIYVADRHNNRVQIFSPEGKYLKTLKATWPELVRVHQKTGAIYVIHQARARGKGVMRLSEYASFTDPRVVSYQDGIDGTSMAVDSWSKKPRVWVGGAGLTTRAKQPKGGGSGVEVWERAGKGWKKIIDFDEEAKKEAGKSYVGRFTAGHDGKGNNRVICDASREHLYYRGGGQHMFDLRSGKYLGEWKTKNWQNGDVAFDKRGYMHIRGRMGHKYIYRVDPSQKTQGRSSKAGKTVWFYPELPYDYGVACLGMRQGADPFTAGSRGNLVFEGGLKVVDQYYVDGSEHGFGVNMRGDVVAHSTIVYVPKMEDVVKEATMQTLKDNKAAGIRGSDMTFRFDAVFSRFAQDMARRGQELYYIKKRPGIPLTGGVLWTWDATGELRQPDAAIIQYNINGSMIDEDGKLYFLAPGPRIFDPKDIHFLAGAGGTFGAPKDERNRHFFTGTAMKTRGKDAKMLMAKAKIPLQPLPDRTPDLTISCGANSKSGWTWMDGAEWIYAGIGPIKSSGCQCPTSRLHLDWYKRTYAPEGYRHSFAAIDTAGNLITHIGQYGNFDSIDGSKSKVLVGRDGIGMFENRFMTGTDNYLVYEAWGEGIVVLKIAYHEEAEARIQ